MLTRIFQILVYSPSHWFYGSTWINQETLLVKTSAAGACKSFRILHPKPTSMIEHTLQFPVTAELVRLGNPAFAKIGIGRDISKRQIES